jgi:pimeloyl-ACP methyl ester carboxylesterase
MVMNAALDGVMPARRIGNDLGESVHRFGPGLVGVLHRPRSDAEQGSRRTAVILFNAGLVHRVGPYREYVDLARALASAGFAVLRFDQSGLGDSAFSTQATIDRRQREARAAMTLIGAETGALRFVLSGLCSGADDAFRLAANDHRVVGCILLDGLAYRTSGFWWRHVVPRLFSPRRWWSVLQRIGSGGMKSDVPGLLDYRDFPEQTDARRQLGELVARDTRLLFVFTGGSYYYFNHRGQLAACLGPAARAPQVTLELWRDSDHTFYQRGHRERLMNTTVTWMQTQFGSPRRQEQAVAKLHLQAVP